MSQASSTSQAKRKKILRTRVKVWGRFNLRSEEVFNVDKAEQLIHRAVDGKNSVQTVIKMYGDGLHIGDKGILAALHAEFISYISITAFISLRETPTLLALCNKTDKNSLVTVVQFKDLSALEVVCDIIDRQRAVMTGGRGTATPSQAASSLSRSEVSAVQQQPKPPQQTPPSVIVTAAPKEEPKAQPTVTITEAVTATVSEPTVVSSKETTTTTTTANVTRVEDVSVVVSSSNSAGASTVLFEKRPFVAEITQPPVSAEVTAVVHAPPPPTSTTAATIVEEDDDDNHFRTSIVFGEEIRVPEAAPQVAKVATETAERQKRMESVLLQRANGHAISDSANKRTSVTPIDTVILNYDDMDVEGTHAVFDTPDGPPTQLNESAENLRFRRPQSLQVTASTSSNTSSINAQRIGGSRYVVTSFSSGRSDSPTDSQAIYVRTSPTGSAEQAYRTSTVIYRDSVDGAVERPRVSYVTNSPTGQRGLVGAPPSPQLQVAYQQQQQQAMQLVRLVPVGSARRRVMHQQPAQLYTIQPVAARENGVHLVAK